MLKWFLIISMSVAMWAANPKIYAGLGDFIYDDMVNISQLGELDAMGNERVQIQAYLKRCQNVKERGFSLDNNGSVEEKENYLETLRSLETERKFFVNAANAALERKIQENDFEGYKELLQTGMIDIEKNSDDIINFYALNKSSENTIVEVEDYLIYRQALKKQEAEETVRRGAIYKSYRQRRLEQINRRQTENKAAEVNRIEAEREQKKEEIYKEQKEELGVIR